MKNRRIENKIYLHRSFTELFYLFPAPLQKFQTINDAQKCIFSLVIILIGFAVSFGASHCKPVGDITVCPKNEAFVFSEKDYLVYICAVPRPAPEYRQYRGQQHLYGYGVLIILFAAIPSNRQEAEAKYGADTF